MKRLNPEKLHVEYLPNVSPTKPIIPRRYTLTHSDITAELFLTIGQRYAYEKITSMRDEVLAEWVKINNKYFFNVYLHVDGQFGFGNSAIRNQVFRKELPLALEAIRYGDRRLFEVHPYLDKAPIIVYFKSAYPYFNRVERWGDFSQYR